jgi:hypothetical protein
MSIIEASHDVYGDSDLRVLLKKAPNRKVLMIAFFKIVVFQGFFGRRRR